MLHVIFGITRRSARLSWPGRASLPAIGDYPHSERHSDSGHCLLTCGLICVQRYVISTSIITPDTTSHPTSTAALAPYKLPGNETEKTKSKNVACSRRAALQGHPTRSPYRLHVRCGPLRSTLCRSSLQSDVHRAPESSIRRGG